MKPVARLLVRRVLPALALAAAVLVALRLHQTAGEQPLRGWHVWRPQELSAADIAQADWPGWIAAEGKLFETVAAQLRTSLEEVDRVPANRYFESSPIHAPGFSRDWNRSYTLQPPGAPRGAVVLLHGLTDSPYSLRHIASLYVARGFSVVGIRMPGHGTVPAGLTSVGWREWNAATRLAVREAQRLAAGQPLHIVGYSNGGALAIQYALDAMDDASLAQPAQLILISPMIEVGGFARFAGIAGWPAILPAFARTAWVDIRPEFNPFKYNSFPVNGARQAHVLTKQVARRLSAAQSSGAMQRFPATLVFQSVLDATVSAASVVGFMDHLPDNGSELVLFDVNRSAATQSLLTASARGQLAAMLPAVVRRYRATVVGDSAASPAMRETSTPAGSTAPQVRPLELAYPPDLFSLSHIALPFPETDSLYGTHPEDNRFGVQLGTLALRGERGTILVSADALWRAMSNPFFSYLAARIDAATVAH